MADTEGVSRRRKVFKSSTGKSPSFMLQRIKEKQLKQQDNKSETEITITKNTNYLINEEKKLSTSEIVGSGSLSQVENNDGMEISEDISIIPGPSNIIPTELQETTEKAKQKNIWSPSEHNAFYEAIKAVGKDFEGIARYMRKRRYQKDLQQIRVQYHNAIRLYKSNAKITDEEISHIPKNIFELFIIINGYEWKKKTGESPRWNIEKFRKLLAEGQVNVRKRNLAISLKTPICSAFLKLLPEYQFESSNPEFIYFHLSPKRSIDYNYIKNTLRQSPKIVIRFKMDEKIKTIFEILEKRWKLYYNKEKKRVEIRIAPTEKMNLVDYTTSAQLDGSVKKMSLNKILSRNNLPPFNSSQDGSTSKDNTNKDTNIEINNVFVYNLQSMSKGISNFEVSLDAKISEFYYLCNRQQHIELYYAMNVPDNRTEVWATFRTFICRKYGEKICQEGKTNNSNTVENNKEIDSEGEPESTTEDDFSNKSDNWVEQKNSFDETIFDSSKKSHELSKESVNSNLPKFPPIKPKKYVPVKSMTATYKNPFISSPVKINNQTPTKVSDCIDKLPSSLFTSTPTSSFDCFDGGNSTQMSSLIGLFSPCKSFSNQTLPSDYKQTLEMLANVDSIDFINGVDGFRDLYNTIKETPEKEKP
ncbi:SANT/Myb domain and Homeodomain-like-containing protein [Strongyloides ratti]|uniref:SANT/Myb domain and Homeodomain-like-containing protein n=1 Tax=Strongyloides ratti TaxID=34506 RepID=A0A090L957_STRRB|nr:SANT/Myb domain and Homeodomain-like-containing protein [Strongyloides ratti]CEF64673.1 SANT/Myb domain and Homeodomain-like-containing protein [Strongyloides ratti]